VRRGEIDEAVTALGNEEVSRLPEARRAADAEMGALEPALRPFPAMVAIARQTRGELWGDRGVPKNEGPGGVSGTTGGVASACENGEGRVPLRPIPYVDDA